MRQRDAHGKTCGNLTRVMRRAEALLIVLALLATPLALLARAQSADGAYCTRNCCPMHGSHAVHHRVSEESASAPGDMCPHSKSVKQCGCSMRSQPHSTDFGLIAPVVPTTPSALATIFAPDASGRYFVHPSEPFAIGFSSALFEPPRA